MHNPHLITVVQLMPSPAPTGGGLVLGTDGEGFGVVGFCLGLIRRALVCRALPGCSSPWLTSPLMCHSRALSALSPHLAEARCPGQQLQSVGKAGREPIATQQGRC